jgi:hypothetical protein
MRARMANYAGIFFICGAGACRFLRLTEAGICDMKEE